jgi:hypothetical protein
MQTEQYQGRYVASRHNAPDGEEISIELKENGHGNWMVGDEDVEIRWEIRKRQLVLHTKSGGVVIGELSGDKIEIKQADGGYLILEKVKQH